MEKGLETGIGMLLPIVHQENFCTIDSTQHLPTQRDVQTNTTYDMQHVLRTGRISRCQMTTLVF